MTAKQVREVRKGLVALAAVVGQILAAGLATGAAAKWLAVGLAALAAIGIYVAPNVPPTG